MLIKNVILVTPEKTYLGNVKIDNDRISDVHEGHTTETGLDAGGLLLMPAYWDLHTHGGYGFSFNEMADFNETTAAKYLENVVREGVCAVLATCVTDSLARIKKVVQNYEKLKKLDTLDIVKGLYFEGPFISKVKKGAHDQDLMLPFNIVQAKEIVGPQVKVITVTPEQDSLQTYEAISFASEIVSVSIGHSNATAEQFLKAVEHGVNRVTHLYNAMTGFQHRSPGVVNGVFALRNLFVELIPDGVHVDPLVVKETLELLDSRHDFIFVSDSLSLKGMPDGETKLGPVPIEKRGDFCYLPDSENLAGSCLPYNRLVERFNAFFKTDPARIAKWTASNPAKSLGFSNEGVIRKGAVASFVLLDKQTLAISSVFIKGRKIS